jgi:preprotein translocase subunit SecD
MQQRQVYTTIAIVVIIVLSIWIDLPNTPGFPGMKRKITTRLGLDLVGGVQALLEADLPADQAIDPTAMQTARSIVENRVNGLGVTEALVQQAGDRRIVVEIPGETDPEQALATLKQTGLLEFVDFSALTSQEAVSLVGTKIQTDFAGGGSVQPSQTVTPTATLTTTQTITPTQTAQIFHTIMTGAELKTVSVTSASQLATEPEVAFELSADGATTFRDFTSANIGKVLAIVLDKEVISSPTINDAITDGKGVIRGNFTVDTANALAVQLRYGSLPIPLKVVESRTVGPTLGQDSLRKSLIAGVVGFAVVVLFMGLYYRLPGLVAIFAILVYALVAFALFRFIPITLTLPGIAGFLLSTGSALDANILIFERLKEELRAGQTLRQAVKLGWERAWPSIRDSNIATLITCGILFWFGNTFGATIVKGFSLTLALGVLVSLFSAILVTRTVLGLVLDNVTPKDNARWFGL